MPKRVRQSRAKGARMPPGCRSVARPSRYGNPFHIDEYREFYPDADDGQLAALAVSDFEGNLHRRFDDVGEGRPYPSVDEVKADLAGADLACFCAPGQPCHVDVLLKVANA